MSNPTPLQGWALIRLQSLLSVPISDADLLEAITYATTLQTPIDVSGHFQNLLGDSPEAFTFISDFNTRIFPSNASSSQLPNSGSKRGLKNKKKQSLNQFKNEPRLPNDGEFLFSNPQAMYNKKDSDLEDEYYIGRSKKSVIKPSKPTENLPAQNLTTSYAVASKPAIVNAGNGSNSITGKLTSDLITSKTKKSQKPVNSAHKFTISGGGSAMRGNFAELSDLECALRALEISTNPVLTAQSIESRRCRCQGLVHEVLQAAPNCLSCGKIICIKEGLGPCTFCSTPLLSASEVQDMVRSLRQEAGREKLALNVVQNKRVVVSKAHRQFTPEILAQDPTPDESLKKAQEHRDKLLGFQATSAQRTKIIDEAADFETPLVAGGLNPWSTPAERALQLKKQQKTMRMMDWQAKEAYENRRVVVAIDLKGNRVVKEMQEIEMPQHPDDLLEEEEEVYDDNLERGGDKGKGKNDTGGGLYAKNPLLKGMIKPVYETRKKNGREKWVDEDGDIIGGFTTINNTSHCSGKTGWRRVQDSFEDNEDVILDSRGGGREGKEIDEPACG